MYSLLKMGIFHCHVSLPEGNIFQMGAQPPSKNGKRETSLKSIFGEVFRDSFPKGDKLNR